jgi:carbamoylphosphate synthase small subunit
MWITDDSELLLEVLEIHDDHLVVVGKGKPFQIRPNPEAVTLSFGPGDPSGMVQAAQAAGYDPQYIGEVG